MEVTADIIFANMLRTFTGRLRKPPETLSAAASGRWPAWAGTVLVAGLTAPVTGAHAPKKILARRGPRAAGGSFARRSTRATDVQGLPAADAPPPSTGKAAADAGDRVALVAGFARYGLARTAAVWAVLYLVASAVTFVPKHTGIGG